VLIKDIDMFLEEDEDIDFELFEEEEEEHRIWLEGRVLYVKKYDIKIRAGYYEAWDEESEKYEIDFDFYMFFNAATNEHLYEEAGSSLEVCLYNYLTSNKNEMLTMEQVENLECGSML